MVKKFPNIERGESASLTGRRHIPTRVFKQAEKLTRQAAQIQATIDSINPLNLGKKRNEAIALLHKFFPGMESFETQVKKYKREIDSLEKENAALVKERRQAKRSALADSWSKTRYSANITNYCGLLIRYRTTSSIRSGCRNSKKHKITRYN